MTGNLQMGSNDIEDISNIYINNSFHFIGPSNNSVDYPFTVGVSKKWGASILLDASGTPGVDGGEKWLMQSTAGEADQGQGKFIITRIEGIDSITKFTIDASGNVGIGTYDPSAKLDVSGSTLLNTSRMSITYADTVNYIQTRAASTDISGDLFFGNWGKDKYASERKFMYKADGKIGMGTHEPYSQLHIKTANDLSFNGDTSTTNNASNIYGLLIENQTTTDISGTVALGFSVENDVSHSRKASSAIVLEPSGNSYAMNFYVATGAVDISGTPQFGIENESQINAYANIDMHDQDISNVGGISMHTDAIIHMSQGQITDAKLITCNGLHVDGDTFMSGQLDMDDNIIKNVTTPADTSHNYVATVQYVADHHGSEVSGNYLNLSGGTMAGDIDMGGAHKINNIVAPDASNSTSAISAIWLTDKYLSLHGAEYGAQQHMQANLDMGTTNSITNVLLPADSSLNYAATVQYVANHHASEVSGNYLNLSGGTMGGTIDMSSNKISNVGGIDMSNGAIIHMSQGQITDAILITCNGLHVDGDTFMSGQLDMDNNSIKNVTKPADTSLNYVATVQYVADHHGSEVSGNYLNLSGGTMGGTINMNGNTITNAGMPVNTNDVATKVYVDTEVSHVILDCGHEIDISNINTNLEYYVILNPAGGYPDAATIFVPIPTTNLLGKKISFRGFIKSGGTDIASLKWSSRDPTVKHFKGISYGNSGSYGINEDISYSEIYIKNVDVNGTIEQNTFKIVFTCMYDMTANIYWFYEIDSVVSDGAPMGVGGGYRITPFQLTYGNTFGDPPPAVYNSICDELILTQV